MLNEERNKINDKSRKEWENLIDQWIHNEIDRAMMKRRYLDGLTYERLCDEFPQLQIDQIKRRIKRAKMQLFKHI